MAEMRQLIVSAVGHVDHGKSSILDAVRGSCIVDTEAGKITQAIGASMVPGERIQELCGAAISKDLQIPGLLFVDTPGHAAFTSIRKRGGHLADMAVLVVDINEGFKPQTIEALEILKQFKTPFIVVANKSDLISGWQSGEPCDLLKKQSKAVISILDKKIYELVGKLFEFGFQSDRFDRLSDFSKQIAIVPVSARTKQGIPQMLMVLMGLAQRFMTDKLTQKESNKARGTVLEVKEVTGLGKVIDCIIYSGEIKKGQTLILGGIDNAIQTKIKALLVPDSLCEIRDKKARFKSEQSVKSAAAVRISGQDIEGVVAGVPLISFDSDSEIEEAKQDVMQQIDEILLDVDGEGVIVRADSLGSLEALLKMLKEADISVKSASIGTISKRDVAEAESSHEKEPLSAVILGFNVKIARDAEDILGKKQVKVICNEIIYQLIDQYQQWKSEKLRQLKQKELDKLVPPAILTSIPGYVFRQSNPAIFGVEVTRGKIRTETVLMTKEGKILAPVKAIQENQDSLQEAEKDKKVAISLFKIMIGRQINEGDVLYSVIPEADFKKFKELKDLLTKDQRDLLKEIAGIMRKENAFWGI